MNQTAVQWLEEQLDNLLELYPSEIQKVNSLFQQAKEIEKQQIIDAWENGAYEIIDALENGTYGGGQFTSTFDSAEQYYKETFKQNN